MCNILFDKGGSKKRLFLRTTFKVKIILLVNFHHTRLALFRRSWFAIGITQGKVSNARIVAFYAQFFEPFFPFGHVKFLASTVNPTRT